MDIATFLGIVSGFGLIISAIFMGGAINSFYDLGSIMITLGGTIAATFVNFPMAELRSVFSVTRVAFTERLEDPIEIIAQLTHLAELARREGILALDNRLDEIEDPFLRKGLELVVDGVEPEATREILEMDIRNLEERHKVGRSVFMSMGTYSPAFGMIGTLIGLIQMLRNLNDPSKIGPGMATALITTFYGAMLAYLVFLPLAGKLQVRSAQEAFRREIMLDGILSIQSGDNPHIVEEKLKTYLPRYLKENREFLRRARHISHEEQA